jgi:hypothetical protein
VEILAEFEVSAHKLAKGTSLDAFLKAVVVRNRTGTANEMLSHYVSKARGKPDHLPFSEVVYSHDLDIRLIGYFCGDWESWASAMREYDQSVIDAIRRERRR